MELIIILIVLISANYGVVTAISGTKEGNTSMEDDQRQIDHLDNSVGSESGI